MGGITDLKRRKVVKKKLFALMLVVMMCVSVLTGCSLVTDNEKLFYEAIIVTINFKDGTTQEITKRDLIAAYNSYGSDYVEDYDYSEDEALKTTLESVINRKIVCKQVENYYKSLPQSASQEERTMLLGSETTYLWDQTFASLYNNLRTYYNEEKGEENSGETNNDEETPKSLFKEFKPNVYVEKENGQYVIKKQEVTPLIRDSYAEKMDETFNHVYDYEWTNSDGVQVFKNFMYTEFMKVLDFDGTGIVKHWKNAINKYVSTIKKNYGYIEFKNDEEVLKFEFDRVYNIIKENYIVQKYAQIYNAQEGTDLTSVTATNVLKYYQDNARASYSSYVVAEDTAGYESAILSNSGNVYYILQDGDVEDYKPADYFNLAYIKINPSSDIQDLATEYQLNEDKFAQGSIDEQTYKATKEQILRNYKVAIRDSETGNVTDDTISASNLYKAISGNAVLMQEYSTLEDEDIEDLETLKEINQNLAYAKAKAFRDYFYRYNDDDTYKNVDRNAVFGINAAGEVLNETFKENSTAQEAVKKLYNNGKAQIGDLSELVVTKDGAYIFFYAGKMVNMFDNISSNFTLGQEAIKTLANTRLNIFNTKTYLDLIFETLNSDNFYIFQNADIDNLKNTLVEKEGIKIHTDNLKEIYK